MKILIPDTIALHLQGDADAVVYDVTAEIPPEHRDAEVLVTWHNSREQLESAARSLPGLRLVQSLASGADVVLAAGFDQTVPVCSGRSLHDGPVAEHALALILSGIRRLDRLHDAQQQNRWDEDFIAAQSAPETQGLYTLAGSRVAIWGFGSIASRLAPMLQLLGADVRGIARSAGSRSGVEVVAEADAAGVLAETDVLVSLIPATPATADLFDRTVFGMLKPGAVFVNVGRGATVDEDALLDALASGGLRAAAIDVMKKEPLGADSPLWAAPNLVITPHVAGNRPVGGSELIDANVARLAAGEELVNQVRP
ncbi:NAD(P)-dependent oxidoreductase [Microbacterium sp. SD291]|uniref:NAD(P)-dependent oxidoreductase n=1 Tax=Microbacterium sp. SD291 TaxID=2782007 RepID=UPI001A95AFA5|nr:NAD(P)-dependent oxidoreductase [Microbacterium sp. SD291]MBO0981683.1 phosphoglycerate dehydrogenase [Microbacterium sp. SD291]